jgi:hypothetical protein
LTLKTPISPISCQFYSTLNPHTGISDDVSEFIQRKDKQLVDDSHTGFQLIGGDIYNFKRFCSLFLKESSHASTGRRETWCLEQTYLL